MRFLAASVAESRLGVHVDLLLQYRNQDWPPCFES